MKRRTNTNQGKPRELGDTYSTEARYVEEAAAAPQTRRCGQADLAPEQRGAHLRPGKLAGT